MAYPPIEVFDELASTNAELMERGRAGAPQGTAIRARVQTAGRGQRSHGWASPEGGLYLSVLIRPQVSATLLPGLPVACALGVLGALRGVGCRAAQLKWPNDVVVAGCKLAGILTELGTSEDGTFAVCGVGVNMQVPALDERRAAGTIALPPTGLAEELDATSDFIDVDKLAFCVQAGILDAVAVWETRVREGAQESQTRAPLSALVDDYNAVLAFRDEPVQVYVIDGEPVETGVFRGVDAYGHALVEHENGDRTAYDAAAVSLRPQA